MVLLFVVLMFAVAGQASAQSIAGVDQINIATQGLVNIRQGEPETIALTGPLAQVQAIALNRTGSRLLITAPGNNPDITITVTVSEIKALSVSGQSRVVIESLQTPRLSLVVSDEASVSASNLAVERLVLDLSNFSRVALDSVAAGQLIARLDAHASLLGSTSTVGQLQMSLSAFARSVFSGTTQAEYLDLSGYAAFDGEALAADEVRLSLRDYSSADVRAKTSLEVSSHDFGHVNYQGDVSARHIGLSTAGR